MGDLWVDFLFCFLVGLIYDGFILLDLANSDIIDVLDQLLELLYEFWSCFVIQRPEILLTLFLCSGYHSLFFFLACFFHLLLHQLIKSSTVFVISTLLWNGQYCVCYNLLSSRFL